MWREDPESVTAGHTAQRKLEDKESGKFLVPPLMLVVGVGMVVGPDAVAAQLATVW